MNYQKEKVEKKPSYYSHKKNKVPSNKFNRIGKIHRTLKKEIEGDTNKWKYIWYSWIGIIYNIKIPYYPKQSIDLTQFLLKFSLKAYFTDLEQIFQKVIWNK